MLSIFRKTGTSLEHTPSDPDDSRHLVWKLHPAGAFRELGTSPVRIIRARIDSTSGSGTGTADSKDMVYG